MKKNLWRKLFVLPLIPTLLVMAAAAGLMLLAFQWRLFDLRGAAIYMFATYARKRSGGISAAESSAEFMYREAEGNKPVFSSAFPSEICISC